jgi:hypothetical protein
MKAESKELFPASATTATVKPKRMAKKRNSATLTMEVKVLAQSFASVGVPEEPSSDDMKLCETGVLPEKNCEKGKKLNKTQSKLDK